MPKRKTRGEIMELVELTEQEFKEFADTHPQISFHQTKEWGHLKEENGWKMHLVGLKEKDKIVAGALLLSKMTPIKRRMFYSPRGFLIDYNNYDILSEFTKKIKEYVKKEKGIFLKIDPYVSYQERDINGNIVEDGENNKQAYQNLIKLGYKHFGFNLMQDTLQPRWMFITKTKDRTIDDIMKEMDPKTRQILRKNERDLIKCREIEYEELPLFKDIMQHTGDRREFIDRPLKYYQDMYNHLHQSGILKILIAELNTKDLVNTLKSEIETYQKEYEERKQKYETDPSKMNAKKYETKQKETENNIARVEKRIEKIEKLKEENGEIIPLGGILFLIYGKEVLSLVGGSYSKFMEFQSAYTVHFAGMKYALENGYDRYNFYGITGDFREENPLFGLYSFKRDFGGQVVELMGEFDLIISKPLYYLYKVSYASYRTLKNIKNHIRKK